MPPLTRHRIDRPSLDARTAALGAYWDLPPAARVGLLDGVAELVNELNQHIDDGYAGVASADDGPALLLRQLAHARRRLR